jgi:hypothetical protein
LDRGKIIEDCQKDELLCNADSHSPRAKEFLSKIQAN